MKNVRPTGCAKVNFTPVLNHREKVETERANEHSQLALQRWLRTMPDQISHVNLDSLITLPWSLRVLLGRDEKQHFEISSLMRST